MDITQKLGLKIPDRYDKFSLEVYNENFKKLDRAIILNSDGSGGGFNLEIEAINDQIQQLQSSISISAQEYERIFGELSESDTVIKQSISNVSQTAESITQSVTQIQRDMETLDDKISSTKIEMTPDEIISSITTGIDGQNLSLSTTSTILNKDGFTVKNGAFTLLNALNEKVMWVDTEGHLTTNSLYVNGTGNQTVTFGGTGSKSINLKSDDGGSTFINFISKDNTKSRIGVYNSSNRSGQLFIEPGSADKNVKAVLIVRGANSNASGNEAVQMELYGNMVVTQTITVHEYISLPGARRAVGSTNIRHLRAVNRGSGEYYLEIGGDGSYPALGITAWISDEKLKENIKHSKVNALSKILQIKPYEFDYKAGGHKELGFIAQQLESIEPSWVNDVGEEEIVKQPVAHEILVYAVKAIQEQQETINKLTNEIKELKFKGYFK